MIFILMKCYVFCWLLIDGCTVYSWGELFDICTYYFFTEPSVEETLPAQCENLGSGWNMGRWFICKWMPLEILLKSNSGVGWHVHFYFRKMWKKKKKFTHFSRGLTLGLSKNFIYYCFLTMNNNYYYECIHKLFHESGTLLS